MERFLEFKVICLVVLIFLFGCDPTSKEGKQNESDLYSGFQDPPSEARPFVRWWWNGNILEKEEIVRQLDVLRQAGIGGVEINPIAMKEEADNLGLQSFSWMSKEWNEMLKFAALEVKKRGMLADLIAGSGWPFGGEFLKEDEVIQRIIVHKIPVSGGQQLSKDLKSLYRKAFASISHTYRDAKSYDMVFARLVPSSVRSTEEIIDLTDDFKKNNRLELEVPAGNYELVYGILQHGNHEVMVAVPGATGLAMDHYRKEITRAYLNRLNKISEDTGMPLSELIRALFCDSIELDGTNWTEGFGDLFFKEYNYRLEPWFPFVFYDPYIGYPEEKYEPAFADQLKRVRYDYNKLLVKTFLENFTQEFQNFCTERDLLCRYQAYGTPFLMGLMEGNMIADIPESNNWIYSADMDSDAWTWSQRHGYMIWNNYAAAGGHLTGKKIISHEAMTNGHGIFKTSLEEIKQHDDMNFITGMTHAVLHGYNYSPVQAGFPGWIFFGTYFSEQNTWWPYFSKWVDYNARLSYVFQNSAPQKSIAILAPEADIWGSYGLSRVPFHTKPWYCNRLWEPISQAGSSCDYIGQIIIREGHKKDGSLTYGPMSYQTILLLSVQSLEPETALALLDFVKNGGKLVAVDGIPNRSVSFQNASENDALVKRVFEQIISDYPNRFFEVASPETEDNLLPWTLELFSEINIQKDIAIDVPDKTVYQIHKKAGNKDIWFFANSGRIKTVSFNAVFPTGKKTPWIWNPEDGTRSVFPCGKNMNELTIELKPFESLLLVFEPGAEEEPGKPFKRPGERILTVEGSWEVTFEHVNGQSFKRNFSELKEFGTSPDAQLNTFAGTVTYKTTFNMDEQVGWLALDKVNKGVTEVSLNGKKVGLNWYGKPVFNIENAIKSGENKLEIRYTTVLSNYVMSLKNNPTAQRWTSRYKKIPMGIEGNIKLIANTD